MIAARSGYSGSEQDEIYMMGLLHDVGKIGVPDEMTTIPRQGWQASYAVIAMELAEDENDYLDEAFRRISAIKVINGEERDTFIGQAADNTMESLRELIRDFHMFAGYLPLVGHDIEEVIIPALKGSHRVYIDKYFIPQQN